VKNGYAVGAAAEYALMENLEASAGFLYTKTGADKDSYVHLNPALNSITVCGGALYRINEKLSVELGVLKPFYFGDEGISAIESTTIDLDKSLWIIAVGAQYKIF
jgi:long-subunit fatty acid transport protein